MLEVGTADQMLRESVLLSWGKIIIVTVHNVQPRFHVMQTRPVHCA